MTGGPYKWGALTYLKGQLPAPFPVRITPSKIVLPGNN